MDIQFRRTLLSLSVATVICGTAVATVYAGLGEVRLDQKATLSKTGDYFPYCGLLIDPVGRYIHDAPRDGDKWTKFGPFNCDRVTRFGCPEMPIIDSICFPNN
jgi:hypothetical protein